MRTLDLLVVVDDGSPAGAAASRYAERLAEQFNAELHHVRSDAAATIRDAIVASGAQLVVVPADAAAMRVVVEQSAVPVLIAPTALPEARPLWRAVVPLTGKPNGDSALTLAVRIGQALKMEVIAVHVADPNAGETGLEAAAHYADAPHHEYPHQLEEFADRALPHCSAAERATLKDLVLCRGDAIAELLGLMRERDADLLVVGWQGRLARPGSGLLERLLRASQRPLLVAKPSAHGPFRLRVGPEFE